MSVKIIKVRIFVIITAILLSVLTACSNNLLFSIYQASGDYTVAFTASPDSGQEPLTVTFTEECSAKRGEIILWQWDFDNDGIIDVEFDKDSLIRDIEHTYSAGVYEAVLHIKTNNANFIQSDPITISAHKEITRYTINNNPLPYFVHTGDIDGDGLEDVISTKKFFYGIKWWKNPGTFASPDTAWEEYPVIVNSEDNNIDGAGIVQAADIDDDGDTDIVGVTLTTDDIYLEDELNTIAGCILLNQTYGEPILECLPPTYIAWWENEDISTPGSGNGTIWKKHLVSDIFFIPWDIKIRDIDSDGDRDIISCAKYDEREITTMLDPDLLNPYSRNLPETQCASCENNQSSRVDQSVVNDRICWWENPGPEYIDEVDTWQAYTIKENLDNPSRIDVADMDNDGDPDVLGSEKDANRFTWWENDGNGNKHQDSWPYVYIATGDDASHAYGIVAAYINPENESPDVITSGDWNGEIVWWKNMDGVGETWEKEIISPSFISVLSLCVADIDNDDDTDIFWGTFRAGQIYWWENTYDATGSVGWNNHCIDYFFDKVYTVYPVDINADNFPDILAAAAEGEKTCWWNLREIQ